MTMREDGDKLISNYPKKSFSHAVVAVDVVLFALINDALNVILLEMDNGYYNGSWAVPGGLVAPSETLVQAASRHLKDRANAVNVHLEQLASFGDPDRDPTGWVVSVAYLGLTISDSFRPETTSRYKSIRWFPVNSLPKLAYDHAEIIKVAIARLKDKILYTNIIKELLPNEFTLSELQNAYEVILEKDMDKRNFRKKMVSHLTELKKTRLDGAHRPAKLYSFAKQGDLIVPTL